MDVLLDYIYELNWFAILIAAIAGFAVNAVWYSEPLFGKVWMKAAGLKKKDLGKNSGFETAAVISFLTMLITTAATAVLVDALAVQGAAQGTLLGVLIGFGFLVTNNGMHKLFERRPFAHFAIGAVGDILTLAAIGAILAVW